MRVAPEVVRQFEAGPDGLELIAVGGPKPEGGDGVLAESPWRVTEPQVDGESERLTAPGGTPIVRLRARANAASER